MIRHRLAYTRYAPGRVGVQACLDQGPQHTKARNLKGLCKATRKSKGKNLDCPQKILSLGSDPCTPCEGPSERFPYSKDFHDYYHQTEV